MNRTRRKTWHASRTWSVSRCANRSWQWMPCGTYWIDVISRLNGWKHERCGLRSDHTALNSPVKKLLNAGEQFACGAANGGPPQVASRPPEVAIHCRRRNIAKLGTSMGDASQRCDDLDGCSGILPSGGSVSPWTYVVRLLLCRSRNFSTYFPIRSASRFTASPTARSRSAVTS